MLHRLIITCGIGVLPLLGTAQSLAEIDTASQMSNTLNAGPVGPPPLGAPGGLPGVSNPGLGLAPPPAVGLPALPGQPGGVQPGQPGMEQPIDETLQQGGGIVQPGVATPTPQPTLMVLKGDRVYDAVTNALLEDAVQQPVPLTDKDKFADDGVHDNGIANDGIRGDVKVIKGQYIGAETNIIKNQLIRLVRNAEDMAVMQFYGYHIMSVNPNEEGPVGKAPNILEKEAQRDQLLRDWNARFLADYRVKKDDPRSEYYQAYVPLPPQPPYYPVPAGYIPPQKVVDTPGPGGVAGRPNIFNGDAVVDEIPQ